MRQYDHEVQGMSVIKPLAGVDRDGPSDAAVLQPLPDSPKGIALAAAHPRYGVLEPERMAMAAIDEALRNVVAVGGDPARTALLDNFSWGNCKKPDRLGALVKAARGCYEAAKAYGTPFISGKDSLNNEYRVGEESRPIPPTLFVSAMGVVPNVANCVTMDSKQKGNLLLLVGWTKAELGGSEYHAHLGLHGGTVPTPDLTKAPRLFAKLHASMRGAGRRVPRPLRRRPGGRAAEMASRAASGPTSTSRRSTTRRSRRVTTRTRCCSSRSRARVSSSRSSPARSSTSRRR